MLHHLIQQFGGNGSKLGEPVCGCNWGPGMPGQAHSLGVAGCPRRGAPDCGFDSDLAFVDSMLYDMTVQTGRAQPREPCR
jgi:hypothetical protein